MNRPTVSGDALRQSVGAFPSGVTVVTTTAGGQDHGLTVSSFASLSLSPAMVVVSIENNSSVLRHLAVGAPISVSVLADDQLDLAVRFGRHQEDRFHGVDIHRRGSGAPLIDRAAAWFDGVVAASFNGGDHQIVTVEVQECGDDPGRSPLLYQRGRLRPWSE